jgi:hypothetical protein
MFLTRACLGLAIAEVSAQNLPAGDFASIQSEGQYQPLPDMQMMYQMPDTQMLYQQMPSTEFPGMPPVMLELQVPPVMPELPVLPELQVPQRQAVEVKPDDGSEECRALQASNPLHTGMSPLEEGRMYCSQAADSRWWDVVVKTRNCDGSYAVVVKDDVGTEWPVAQRAYFLDKPCNDFYREVLMEEGLSEEEIRVTLQSQGFKEEEIREVQEVPVETSANKPQTEDKQQTRSRWPVSDKRTPLKVVAAAAAAGAVPLVYGLSGS